MERREIPEICEREETTGMAQHCIWGWQDRKISDVTETGNTGKEACCMCGNLDMLNPWR
jgi:hypothetical protein